jgi:hypothetical protein
MSIYFFLHRFSKTGTDCCHRSVRKRGEREREGEFTGGGGRRIAKGNAGGVGGYIG